MFYHISKSLRELIQYFGINNRSGANGTETGPFYCGMSCELVIPEFAIRLNGPTSTTMHIEIAMRFSGSEGIILQLNNKTWTGKAESFFDSSWISSYPEEDERIMVGGRFKLEIESVRVMKTKNNYETFVQSFQFLDKLLSGDCDGIGNISSENVEIVSKCISYYLNISSNSFDDYIKDTFWLFCNQKKDIIINLNEMNIYVENKDFVNIIMYSVKNDNNIGSNNINIFKCLLFDLFPNGNQIIIYTTSNLGLPIYPFSILYLLSNIIYSSSTSSLLTKSFKKIIIKAVRRGGRDSWVSKAFDSKLEQEFTNKKININLR